MISKLGGTLLEDIKDAKTATHVIAADKKNSIGVRRTPKLLIGLSVTSNIVDLSWLLQSAKKKEVLDSESYLCCDKEAEKNYEFSLKESCTRGDELRREGKALFDGYWIHVCKGVAGNKTAGKRTPPSDEVKLIVEGAGATWLPTLSPKMMEQHGVDASKVLIITSDPETKKEVGPKAVADALNSGAEKQTIAWLFKCIMTQKIT